MVFSLLEIHLPEAVSRSFQLIGQAAGGVALFLTGLILSAQRIELGPNVLSGTLVKNVVHPVLAIGLIDCFRSTGTPHGRRFCYALCRPVLRRPLRPALRHRVHVAGSTLIVSSLASVVTVSVALVLTAGW